MKKELIGKILVTLICVLLVIISFYAKKIIFYDANMATSDFKYTQTTQDKPLHAKTNIWFDYGAQRELKFGFDKSINSSEIKIFSKENGTQIVSYNKDDFGPIKPNSVGYLIASAPEQYIDINQDGIEEKVFDFTRTEFGPYAYLGGPSELFNTNKIPFELLFSHGKHIKVYYKGNCLSNGTITVVSKDGTTKDYNIDEEGNIESLPISNIRNGFTGIYTPDGKTYYRMYYILEGYQYFSRHYFTGYIPLLLLIGYSFVGIILVYFIREAINRKNLNHKVYSRKNSTKTNQLKKTSKFEKIRWFFMIISFLLWNFLGYILMQGQLLNDYTIPTFTCPLNFDQIIQTPCFFLSHTNHLVEEGLLFCLTFLGSCFIWMVLIGRLLCGFMCPFGFIQDILDKIREKLHIKPIIVSDRMLKLIQPIKWVWIILFISLVFLGGDFCDICPNKIISPSLGGYWVDVFVGGFIGVIVIVGSFYIKRFWCLMCPLGYILGIFHKYNLFKLKKDCTSCTECGACYEECPMKIKNIYTERKKENVQETDCIMCGKCIDQCPENKGLEITLLRKTYL